MSILDQWEHRWFGIWKEYGDAYQNCPSIYRFIIPEIAAHYLKKPLRNYLTTAPIVASTSRASFPCPFTGERKDGAISFRTDGYWLWLDDLADYIDQYNVCIPSAWLHEIIKYRYIPPDVGPKSRSNLEWPPIIK
jgi:hypothetical protein